MGDATEDIGGIPRRRGGGLEAETGDAEGETPAETAAVPVGSDGVFLGCEEQECQICYSPFEAELRPPRLLECGHTFCLHCLSRMHQAQPGGGGNSALLACPLCRRRTALPDGHVHKLPTGSTQSLSPQPPPSRRPQQQQTGQQQSPPPPLPTASAAAAAAAVDPVQQRRLPEEGAREGTSSPPSTTATCDQAAARPVSESLCCKERLKRLMQKLPWEWVAFCVVSAVLLSVAFVGPIMWNLSPWILFLSVSLCCILSCCLITCYTEIRKYRRESYPCPPCLVMPFPDSCI